MPKEAIIYNNLKRKKPKPIPSPLHALIRLERMLRNEQGIHQDIYYQIIEFEPKELGLGQWLRAVIRKEKLRIKNYLK